MIKIIETVPLMCSYKQYVKGKEKIEGVYKITFSDGSFYIGMTSNFHGRVYNHCNINDLNVGSKVTPKHKRMIVAIINFEKVEFELIDNDINKEKDYLKIHLSNVINLNKKL